MSVYFIACGGYIKIGYSEDPEKRAANLFRSTSRYSAPRAAYLARGTQRLLRHFEGDMSTELGLHEALDDYAAGCEWFIDEPELREWIASAEPDRRYYPRLVRPSGPVYRQIPHEERGGGNAELAMQVLDKRRKQWAAEREQVRGRSA